MDAVARRVFMVRRPRRINFFVGFHFCRSHTLYTAALITFDAIRGWCRGMGQTTEAGRFIERRKKLINGV